MNEDGWGPQDVDVGALRRFEEKELHFDLIFAICEKRTHAVVAPAL